MEKWEKRKRPLRLERRFEFESYDRTRDFLDALGEYSERINSFPDISFGKTYVNITLRPKDEDCQDEMSEEDLKIASDIDALIF